MTINCHKDAMDHLRFLCSSLARVQVDEACSNQCAYDTESEHKLRHPDCSQKNQETIRQMIKFLQQINTKKESEETLFKET